MAVTFQEMSGPLAPTLSASAGRDGHVVLSSLGSGAAPTAPQKTIGIKFVGSGQEVYRFAGKSHSVVPGHFLIVPEQRPGDAAIPRSEGSAVGLCIYLPVALGLGTAEAGLEEPLTFGTECTALGRLLHSALVGMHRAADRREEVASRLIGGISSNVAELICEAQQQMSRMEAVKASTRYETLRRVNIARAFLHGTTDRAVDLAELAREAGMSRFHLLRHFRDIVGEPPAAYHRRVRLDRARDALRTRSATSAEIAHRFGFADASSFSHAYRRRFGEAPLRSVGR